MFLLRRGLLECSWVSNYSGKLIFKTLWTTGNLVWPIVIVSLTLKSTNAKQCREAANKLLLCVFPLCMHAHVHARAHISNADMWVDHVCAQVLPTCVCAVWASICEKATGPVGNCRRVFVNPPPSNSVCSFCRLETVCSEAWERPLHTRLARSRWWRDLGTHPPMEAASGWDAAEMQWIQATAQNCQARLT